MLNMTTTINYINENTLRKNITQVAKETNTLITMTATYDNITRIECQNNC